ncbi:MAG TPA: glycosyltransferase family 4 protein [Candidatus Nanoarchaeia archaeon]|nr:glycosyltransferase family 4 protein [Candidatus Nanoarchaeia archaeon]
MGKLTVAIVMPTHFDVHSSLLNFLKTYEYLIKNRNVDVTLFTDSKNNIDYNNIKIEKINRIVGIPDYIGTGINKLFFLFGIPRFYYKGLDEKLKNFDVITSNNPEFYAFAYQAYASAKKHNKRFVLRTSQSVEGFFLFRLTKFLVCPFVKKAYDFSRFVIFSNPQAEERCLRLGLIDDRKRSIITGHATDTKCFKLMKVKKSSKKILLSVGGLYELKGHHIIIKALRKLMDKGNKNIELWIVGEGYYKESLQKLVISLNLEKQVKFLGAKGHNELAKIYNMSDVFVLANYQEITPAVNEALACGKPVVVMECGGMDFVIPDEIYGLRCKKFDAEDMAKKINVLLKNKKLAAKIAANGRKRILENFSIEKVADKIYEAYTE